MADFVIEIVPKAEKQQYFKLRYLKNRLELESNILGSP